MAPEPIPEPFSFFFQYFTNKPFVLNILQSRSDPKPPRMNILAKIGGWGYHPLRKQNAVNSASLPLELHPDPRNRRHRHRRPVHRHPNHLLPFRHRQRNRPLELRAQRRRPNLTARPATVDLHSAPRPQTAETPRRPGPRQRRQQPHHATMTLQQHLRKPRRPAEIAVNLKRR